MIVDKLACQLGGGGGGGGGGRATKKKYRIKLNFCLYCNLIILNTDPDYK